MRRTPIAARLVAASLGALLLASAGVPAGASTGDESGTASASSEGAAVAGPTVTTKGRFVVIATDHGSTVRWRPASEPRVGDARPEIAVDGVSLRIPFTKASSGEYFVRLPGVTDVTARQLSVVAAGRVLDGASDVVAGPNAAKKKKKEPKPALTVERPSTLLAKDPGVRGKHKTVAFTYRAPKVRVGGFPVKSEVLGRVVLPAAKTAKGKRPLVLILHGRHGTCYSDTGGEDLAWPCPEGFKPTPSYLGYEYVQQLLASQGYATVSISANGINAQDADVMDAGASARSELVQHHLDLLAKANARGGDGNLKKLKGRLNLAKTVFVGHSRGGEGVNRATVDLSRSTTATVRGQVLIAPTDFGFQVSPGVPTTVLLPYCDGDVFDLQGQAYVDQGRYVTPQDKAMKSAVMMFGANHNYFNTEWTPGMSKAPSFDDWWDPSDQACGDKAPQRLSAKQQQNAGATYIAATVKTVLAGDKQAAKLLDGSAVRARSAGKAAVLSSGFTGLRRPVASSTESLRVKASGGMSAEKCSGGYGFRVTPCDAFLPNGLSPHWLTYSDPDLVPWAGAVALSWKSKGARVRLTPDKPRNLKGNRVDLRVIASGGAGSGKLDVVFTDTKGRTLRLTPERQADLLPQTGTFGSRHWAQTLRVKLPKKAKNFNLKRIASVSLVATSKKGTVFFLDALTSSAKQPKFSRAYSRVPKFDVTAVTNATIVEQPSGVQQIDVKINVTGTSIAASRLAVTIADEAGGYQESVIRVAPGTRSVSVPFRVAADGVFNPYSAAGLVIVNPLRNATVSNYVGELATSSDVPAPTVTFPTRHVEVTQGQPVRWPIESDAMSAEELSFFGAFTTPEGGLPELTAGTVPASYFSSAGVSIPDADTPLSLTEGYMFGRLPALRTSDFFELPTRANPKITGPRHVAVTVFPDDMFLFEEVVLTATINPAP